LFSLCWCFGIFLFALATLTRHSVARFGTPDHTFDCKYCAKTVAAGAKHCRLCNRCRLGFDHHCRFINNCVTNENYACFYFGTLLLVSSGVIQISHFLYAASQYEDHREEMLSRLSVHFGRDVSAGILWFLFAIAIILNLCAVGPMTTLIAYHIFFQRTARTTYGYISRWPDKWDNDISRFCVGRSRHIAIDW
jgi:hypothetical protein